jgi:hypothetical protein
MAKKIVKCHIKRQKGYLYFLDKEGDVSMAKMARGKQKGGRPKKVHACGITRQTGYLYFIDKQGDVSMAQMARGRRRAKKK